MKRKFLVFLSLALIVSIMAIPVFAAENFYLSLSGGSGWSDELYELPYGDSFIVRVHTDLGDFDSLSPVEIPDPGTEECVFSISYPSSGEVTLRFRFMGMSSWYLEYADHSDAFMPANGISLIPYVSSSDPVPSLSGMVDSGMMSGVLDQVVDILPVVLVVVVGFIAVRKGIDFLRGVMSGA